MKNKTPRDEAHSKNLKKELQEDKYRILLHILSPIELEALKHEYRNFDYLLEDFKISVDFSTNRQLLQSSSQKIRMVTALLEKDRFFLTRNNARLKLFLDSPLRAHPISTYLKHRLLCAGCETMYQVIELGRKQIMQYRGVGKVTMAELDAFLKKNGCASLFPK